MFNLTFAPGIRFRMQTVCLILTVQSWTSMVFSYIPFDLCHVSVGCTDGSTYHYDLRKLQHEPNIAPLDHKKSRETEDHVKEYLFRYAAGTPSHRTIGLTSRFHCVYDLAWHPLIPWHAAATRSESRPSEVRVRGVQPAVRMQNGSAFGIPSIQAIYVSVGLYRWLNIPLRSAESTYDSCKTST